MEEMTWGIAVAIDVFLAGLTAGAYCVAILADLSRKERFTNVAKVAALIAPWPAIVGVFMLIAELGIPIRFINLIRVLNASSTMSVGIWLLTVFIPISLVYAFLSVIRWPSAWDVKVRRIVGTIGLPFAFLIVSYRGVLIAATRPALWSFPLLVTIFALYSFSTGLAWMLLIAPHAPRRGLKKDEQGKVIMPLHPLERLNSGIIAAEIGALAVFFAWLAFLPQAQAAVKAILVGQFSAFWWIGVVGIGLVFPLIYGVRRQAKKTVALSTLSAALVLIGGFVWVYVVLAAGHLM